MTLSDPKTLYGIHSMTLYNTETWEPFGIMKVLGSLEIPTSGDFNKLYGGSSRYPYDAEAGQLDVMMNVTIKEFPSFSFEKFLGATTTTTSADSDGEVGSLTNKNGTTISDATTGIASVAAKSGSESDLKDGLYIIKCPTDGATVDVYCMTDADFAQGTDKAFENDSLKITATPLTVATDAAVEVPGFGLEFTGGSGAIAFTEGDTAYFYVKKIHGGSDVITIGQSTQEFPEFGVYAAAQKKADGSNFLIQCFRCRGISLPLSFNEAEWVNSTINIQCLYDSTNNAVMKLFNIKGA